jgi:2-oxoglutarate dehydrogenase E2 component (dihydrolipoamide succinyltransferase)
MSYEIVVPHLGESVFDATVREWLKEPGDRIKIGELVVELETDKVNLEISAEEAGVLVEISHQSGEDVKVGEVLGRIEPVSEEEPAEKAEEMTKEPPAEEDKHKPESNERETQSTPLARRLAEENEIDLSQVDGSGSGGKVTKKDLENYLSQVKGEMKEKEKEKVEVEEEGKVEVQEIPVERPESVPDEKKREERVRMSRRRRTIARRMVEAQRETAMLSTFNEIDMSAVMDLRSSRNQMIQERYGLKLGITSFFVKASIGALKNYPRLNAQIDQDDMILKHYYDIGIAIGDEGGLVVPVIRDADRLSSVEIERKINEYVDKAREGKLSLEEIRGGTFTITNGGVFGSLLSTPILNPPQVAILGLHRIEDRPIALKGQVVIRPMMYVAVSYDHRIVDGREAVQFLARIKELIEDPEELLLEG